MGVPLRVSALARQLPFIPAFCGTPLSTGRLPKYCGVSEMNEVTELATAGLVVVFAAVLLVASHLFIESRFAKQLAKRSLDLRITTNVISGWL
jgi:hypothetical protein